MVATCNSCKEVVVDNENPLEVLKKLREQKSKGVDKKYPLLIADFYCKNTKNNTCDYTKHVKWNELDDDVQVISCPKCGSSLLASVFVGSVNGFYLENYCFNCLAKRGSGTFGHQK